MNIKEDYEWNYRDCYLCKTSTPQKEMCTATLDYEGFGLKGTHRVQVCKECHRDNQVNRLFKSENTEERIRCSQ
jgi:hypothetical protein